MFGIGFTELLLISIVAILFLGPDKLPQAMIEVAKFIKGVKKTVSEAKSSLEEEMKIADLKEEALNYKKQLDEATNELRNFKNIDFDEFEEEISTESSKAVSKETTSDSKETAQEETIATQVEAKNDTITFTKPKKQKKKEATDETTDKPEGDA
ncbi:MULTISPECIES: Sec-independent protein translocase protein TatB [Sulfurovum]|uniref:Sec-independent protein translocase protein TatB homolog n=1 Tax=Sulfurovum xiamenensis TaxID=3019066 RepID=A0ABT7QSS5_9BACT|nr:MULTISPECIES: Sec-independent protein translocase protein TatB [Sulfurovum]EIF50230.1 sec-independent translocase [Sulfurovum sp. AR]MDM5264129.1 Sec-independent protein translocase protein TatB [Sulfurovum xiamenensis]